MPAMLPLTTFPAQHHTGQPFAFVVVAWVSTYTTGPVSLPCRMLS